MDEDNDDGLGGRSRDRKAVTSANRWGRALCALDPVELAGAPLPDVIREAVQLGQQVASSYPARNRQHQRIDKLIRGLEEAEVEAIDRFLADPSAGYEALDQWCARLVGDGDPAIDAWIVLHPATDRQRLRTLVRNARAGRSDARETLRAALTEALGATEPPRP